MEGVPPRSGSGRITKRGETGEGPMSQRDPFYVTTPIYYVNDVPHIGHMYTTIVADVIARYRKMRGNDVRFVTGTDEHGINIQRAAQRQGLQPIQLADRVVERYHALWKQLGISHDDFIRTTEPRHHAAVERLFRKVRDAGDIYEGDYSGWYCASCEAFYPESQLVDGNCPTHDRPTEWLEEPSFFFRLSKYAPSLLELYRRRPEFILPDSRRNEVISFVESGLKDLSISRATLKWGIPVPEKPGHVIYVWFDALTNYISALGYGSDDGSLYDRYWRPPAQAAADPVAPVLHLVGKDILRFHAIYWPAFLMAAGEPIPRTVFAHGWWLNDARKMSKTVGNVIRPGPLLHVLGQSQARPEFGADALRYFLMSEMTFGLDGTYSHDALVERLNADLANNLGNLLSRVCTLISRLPEGRLAGHEEPLWAAAETLRESGQKALRGFVDRFDRYDFSGGLTSVWSLLNDVNRFLVVHEPWKRGGSPEQERRSQAVLYEAVASLRLASACLAPVCPSLAGEIWNQLGLDEDPSAVRIETIRWEEAPRARVRPGKALFARLDRTKAVAEIEKLTIEEAQAATSRITAGAQTEDSMESTDKKPTPGSSEPSGVDDQMTIDEFMKVDLRAGRIVTAERVPKADRLIRLVVDIGTEQRQIVAGIASVYSPEELVGKQVVIVVNLKPAVLRGVESRGMLLAADVDGKPMIATFEVPVPPGARVR
jgi:methionyl-tRNA synthetase